MGKDETNSDSDIIGFPSSILPPELEDNSEDKKNSFVDLSDELISMRDDLAHGNGQVLDTPPPLMDDEVVVIDENVDDLKEAQRIDTETNIDIETPTNQTTQSSMFVAPNIEEVMPSIELEEPIEKEKGANKPETSTTPEPQEIQKPTENDELSSWLAAKEQEHDARERNISLKEEEIEKREKDLETNINLLRTEELANMKTLTELEELKKELDDEEDSLVHKIEQLQAKEDEFKLEEKAITAKRKELQDYDDQLIKHMKMLEKKEKEFSNKSTTILKKEKEIKAFEKKTKPRIEKILKLERKIGEMSSEYQKKLRDITKQEKDLLERENEVSKKLIEIESREEASIINRNETTKKKREIERILAETESVEKSNRKKEVNLDLLKEEYQKKIANADKLQKELEMKEAKVDEALAIAQKAKRYQDRINDLKNTYEALRNKVKDEYAKSGSHSDDDDIPSIEDDKPKVSNPNVIEAMQLLNRGSNLVDNHEYNLTPPIIRRLKDLLSEIPDSNPNKRNLILETQSLARKINRSIHV